MGWSEEGESEEEEGDEFQLPLSLQRQLYASDDEEETNEQQQKQGEHVTTTVTSHHLSDFHLCSQRCQIGPGAIARRHFMLWRVSRAWSLLNIPT